MNYYMDTEFLEGTQKEEFPISLFRKETPETIDLISIGIVSEDNREYHAISKDFNLKEAWNRYDWYSTNTNKPARNEQEKDFKVYWIRENVLKSIHEYLCSQVDIHGKTYHSDLFAPFTYKSMKNLLRWYGKTNKQIAEDIKAFTLVTPDGMLWTGKADSYLYVGTSDVLLSDNIKFVPKQLKFSYYKPEFYAYYGDYDWVGFCWLFGKMLDLPHGFPKYCKDLQQIFDEKKHLVKGRMKDHPDFPKNEGIHNALNDARWDKKLHNFLDNLNWCVMKFVDIIKETFATNIVVDMFENDAHYIISRKGLGILNVRNQNKNKIVMSEENTKELTLGEKRCHINFNPSQDDKIGQFKRMMADAIDFLEDLRNEIPEGEYEEPGEVHRVISLAQTDLKSAQMFGVKGIAKTLKN